MTTIYYRAREDQTINRLPIFFGQVEEQGGRVTGKHYRARIDTGSRVEGANKIYIIGYYWIEQDAAEFHQKFTANNLIKITAEEFDDLLSRWTRDGELPAMCWNPEQNPAPELFWNAAVSQSHPVTT